MRRPTPPNARHTTGEHHEGRIRFSRGKRGAVISSHGKTRITIYLDDAIVERFKADRATGKGYQTLINEALAQTRRRRTAGHGQSGAPHRARGTRKGLGLAPGSTQRTTAPDLPQHVSSLGRMPT